LFSDIQPAVLEEDVRILKQQRPAAQHNDEQLQTTITADPSLPFTRSIETAPLPAVRDLFDPLAPHVLSPVCAIWFEQFHDWFPILHRMSFERFVDSSQPVRELSQKLVFEALVVVTLPYASVERDLLNGEPVELCLSLRAEVLTKAMGTLNLSSLQAVLILTIGDYTAGNMSDFWNLTAIAKR
jgi:hypothetical protein